MSVPANPIQIPAAPSELKPRELDLFAFAILLLGHLRFLLGCGLAAFLLMLAYMLHAKPRFASTAVMIAPQNTSKAALLEAQLAASTSDLLGGAYELYADILKSRAIGDQIIKDYNLQRVYGVNDLESAEQTLTSMTKVETQREGLIRVTVQDTNPRLAADLANDYLRQLDILNSRLVLTSIGEQRVYLEHQMINEKNALADAEVALKEVQESTSGLPPEAEANASLSALESTRVQLRASQVRLDSLLQSETEANPEVIRLRAEISALSGQLNALEHGTSSAETGTPTSKVPQEALVYTRRLREVKFHEALFDLLEKEYEGAKEEESRAPAIVQVLDKAVPALHKAWPPRTLYCLIAGVVGFFLGIFFVLIRAFLQAYVGAPQNAEKLQSLRAIYKKQLGAKA
jgi:uncharacterized protein involved in exopolysaccharide biosynthesis